MPSIENVYTDDWSHAASVDGLSVWVHLARQRIMCASGLNIEGTCDRPNVVLAAGCATPAADAHPNCVYLQRNVLPSVTCWRYTWVLRIWTL